MWIRASSRLSENVAQLTTAVSSHLLALGEQKALVDAPISGAWPRLQEELTSNLGANAPLGYLLLTHSHFDHIGALPLLRRAYPELQVVASPLCSEALADRGRMETAFEQNRLASEALGVAPEFDRDEWLRALVVDRVIGDGDAIPLGGGVEVKAVGCPGHTDDSFAYYVRPDSALAIGEAAGAFHGRGKFSASFCWSYPSYLATIDKLAKLELHLITFPHAGTLAGNQANTYLTSARSTAETMAQSISQRLEQGQLIEEVSSSLIPELLEQRIFPDGASAEATRLMLESMVRAIASGK